MRGLSGRCHVGWLDRRAGTLKLVPYTAGSGWGHKPHGMEHVSPGDVLLVALHLQALHQPGRTNWKGSSGNCFKGESIFNVSCKETAE